MSAQTFLGWKARVGALNLCMLAGLAPTYAAPTVFGDLTIVENRSQNDNFGFNGPHLLTRVDASNDAEAATVSSNNNLFPFASPPTSPVGLTQNAGGSWIKLSAITTANFPNLNNLSKLEGIYTYSVTDGTTPTTHFSHELDRADIIPNPTMLAVSNMSTTPLFTFFDPESRPRYDRLTRVYNLVIFDMAGNEVAVLPSPTMAAAMPAIQVTPGLLNAGQSYWFRAQSIDIDMIATDPHVENIGQELLLFSPVPESAHVIAMGALLVTGAAIRTRRASRVAIKWRLRRPDGLTSPPSIPATLETRSARRASRFAID